MDKVKRKIGICGGTFDPIHHGHLISAQEIQEQFDLDEVIFIPTGNPPHKREQQVTDGEHRFAMVSLATEGNSHFHVSRIEIDRIGYTYTIDTLNELSKIVGEDSELFYIIGADVLNDLTTWKSYVEVFKKCTFIAAFRPGYNLEIFQKRLDYLQKNYQAKILKADIPMIDISSTELREKIRSQSSIRYFVPEKVEEYIKTNKLYIEWGSTK